ncbi:MAG: hypothetical protein R2856_33380 [Caldilineaceae bacterium]
MTNRSVRTVTLTDDAVAKLKLVSTATLTSQLNKRGLRKNFMAGIYPLRPDLRLVGYAFTLRYIPAREDLADELYDNTKNVQRLAVEAIGPGDVLVIDARGEAHEGATLGNILATRLKGARRRWDRHRRGAARYAWLPRTRFAILHSGAPRQHIVRGPLIRGNADADWLRRHSRDPRRRHRGRCRRRGGDPRGDGRIGCPRRLRAGDRENSSSRKWRADPRSWASIHPTSRRWPSSRHGARNRGSDKVEGWQGGGVAR